MKPVAPLVLLVLSLSLVFPWAPAEARPDPTGTAHDDTETDAIRATALDYIEGWYEGDAERMERSLHPHLAKRFVEEIAEGSVRLTETSALQLVQQVRRGGGSGTPAAVRRADVRILDVFQDVASVRVDAHAWIDYMHLAKWRGKWKIVNVLWEIRDREASATGSCEPVEGVENLSTDPVLLFGELHGTDRGPADRHGFAPGAPPRTAVPDRSEAGTIRGTCRSWSSSPSPRRVPAMPGSSGWAR